MSLSFLAGLSFLASREETRRARSLSGGNFRVHSRGSLALPYFTITTTLTITRSLERDPYCGKVTGSIVGRGKPTSGDFVFAILSALVV